MSTPPLLLRQPLLLLPRNLCCSPLASPRSFGGGGSSFDPSEGLADAAEDLLRALRAEPDRRRSASASGSGGDERGVSGSSNGQGGVGGESGGESGGDGRGPAARRADELASDGMWPLFRALGEFADLMDLADRAGSRNRNDSFVGASADAEALSLLRSHLSLLLLPRSELARRLVLLKKSAGPGADAASLARKLPWLLSHEDPGEVVRRATRTASSLMPGVGGPSELAARLFGGDRKSSAGRASQAWLTFADVARGESRKLRAEERGREGRRGGNEG